jgi:hypothetical protein
MQKPDIEAFWDHAASRAVALGIPIIVSILGFILVQVMNWGLWVSGSLAEIKLDIRALKVATHMALETPRLGGKKPVLSFPLLPIESILFGKENPNASHDEIPGGIENPLGESHHSGGGLLPGGADVPGRAPAGAGGGVRRD